MAEYIEREVTIELLRSLGSRDYRREKGTIQEAIKMVSSTEYTPSAEVAPVVHGRWVDGKCSNCGVDIPTDDLHDVIFGDECHYCYYCGAKMDGGTDDASD